MARAVRRHRGQTQSFQGWYPNPVSEIVVEQWSTAADPWQRPRLHLAWAREHAMEFAAYLRGNKLSNTIYENYDDILEKACQAWMFFANDKEQVASITTRQWAKVNL